MNAPTEFNRYDVGFAIGWDYAMVGLDVPHDAEEAITNGYRAGKHHFGIVRNPRRDRFTLKWLQLRRNAWRRDRVFDSAVTPEYLARLTPEICPVTRDRLTVAALDSANNWSVDRVENEAGYARGNLVILSTRANRAKGKRSYLDLLRIVGGRETVVGDLSAVEWARMASLVGMLTDMDSLLPMLVVPPPDMVVRNRYTMLQLTIMAIASRCVPSSVGRAFYDACHGKASKRALGELVRMAAGKLSGSLVPGADLTYAFGDAWADGVLMRYMRAWINATSPADIDVCRNLNQKLSGYVAPLAPHTLDTWSEETRGYIQHPAATARANRATAAAVPA